MNTCTSIGGRPYGSGAGWRTAERSRQCIKLGPRACRTRSMNDDSDKGTGPASGDGESSSRRWRVRARLGAPTLANLKGGDATFQEVKEKYLKPSVYLPGSFAVGTCTFGLKTAVDNFVFMEDPFGFVACALVCGAICMAAAWVLVDFTDSPPNKAK